MVRINFKTIVLLNCRKWDSSFGKDDSESIDFKKPLHKINKKVTSRNNSNVGKYLSTYYVEVSDNPSLSEAEFSSGFSEASSFI